MDRLTNFLNSYKTFGPEWNVLNLFGNKYVIPDNHYETFLSLIATTEINRTIYRFIERNIIDRGPIQIELFFIYEHDTQKRANETHIKSFIQSYTNILKQKFDNITNLDFYILRKPIDTNMCELYQIICPSITIPYKIQFDIRNEMLKTLETIFVTIEYTNSLNNMLDEKIIGYNIWNMANFIAQDRMLVKYTVTNSDVIEVNLPTDSVSLLKDLSIRLNHSKITHLLKSQFTES